MSENKRPLSDGSQESVNQQQAAPAITRAQLERVFADLVKGARVLAAFLESDCKIGTIDGEAKAEKVRLLAPFLDSDVDPVNGPFSDADLLLFGTTVTDGLSLLAEYYHNNDLFGHAAIAWQHFFGIEVQIFGVESNGAKWSAAMWARALRAQNKLAEADALVTLMTARTPGYKM